MRYQFKAFLNDPDAPRPENPIHSTEGGQAHGFRGALVGGIHTYGWTTGAFINLLGDDWLDEGWVDVAFRKPIYDGDAMSVNINGTNFTVTNTAADVCLDGHVGKGRAPFFEELSAINWQAGQPESDKREPLTLDNAPRGKNLIPMTVPLSVEEHEAFINETLAETHPLFHGDKPRCHPAWLAGRPIYLLHHSFDYGPAIHTRSQIQHLEPAHAGQAFTITGRCVDAYDRNGHHFIVNDGSIWSEDNAELVRLRHTAIFRLRTA